MHIYHILWRYRHWFLGLETWYNFFDFGYRRKNGGILMCFDMQPFIIILISEVNNEKWKVYFWLDSTNLGRQLQVEYLHKGTVNYKWWHHIQRCSCTESKLIDCYTALILTGILGSSFPPPIKVPFWKLKGYTCFPNLWSRSLFHAMFFLLTFNSVLPRIKV